MDGTPLNLIDLDEEREKLHTMTDLRLITGGKEPPDGKSGNWLKDLEDGTVFFVQNKIDRRDFNLVLFRLEGKIGLFDKVISLRNPHLPKEIYVDPIRFIQQYDLHHTEGVLIIPEQQKEQANEQSDRLPSPEGEKKEGVDGPSGT